MTSSFHELVIGGVLFAPVISYATLSLIIILAIRPILHVVGFTKMFSHASVAELSLYVGILGIVMLI